MAELKEALKEVLRDVNRFAEHASGMHLRAYQVEVAQAIVRSVVEQRGDRFVVVFPRQSGKNELQAHIETYLLACFSQRGGEMVKISPTWKPQSLNAMRRLERVLKKNLVTCWGWSRESGFIYRLGEARIYFLSGAPTASIVGATASILLECDEAQDVQIAKWDKEVAPMAASTNATRVFWGTAWTSATLLARELRAARQQEKQDGRRRAWVLTAEDVGREVPEYRRYIAGEVARHGRRHPYVRTQYYSEEIDEQTGLFPAERLALMKGEHATESEPQPGGLYAFLIDVAGEDEGQAAGQGSTRLENPGRDSTALTIVRADLNKLSDPLIGKPAYRVVSRRLWTGIKHTRLYGQILALAELWEPRWVVIDATGVGAGLASFLTRPLGSRVMPYVFTQKSKSDLGWNFLSIVETGRYKEYSPTDPPEALQETFWQQCRLTRQEVLPGPGKTMRWSVPDGTRHPQTGELVHDDLVISAAMCAVLDAQVWGTAESAVIHPPDILEELEW